MSSPDDGRQVSLDPGSVLSRQRARHRQAMAQAAQREADLIEEIANLEAYASMLSQQLAAQNHDPAEPGVADPWGGTDDSPHPPKGPTS